MTLDEAWFYLSIFLSFYWWWINLSQSRSWSSTKGEQSPKMTLTVVCNPHEFHLIDALQNESRFHAMHHISHILSTLLEILAPCQDFARRDFGIHADNARLLCPKTLTLFLDHNSPGRAPYPPDSQDLAPQTSSFLNIWNEYFKGVNSTNLMNPCPLSRKFWRESIVRFWMRYFKNGWSDCKSALTEIVNIFSDFSSEMFNSVSKR
jgi:hypothetical protein